MILNLALALSLPATVPAIAPPPAAAPVRIWMKSRRYEPGDPVKVQVETGVGGYLLVLHYTPAGNLEVLFPVGPGDDAQVQADRRYEIRRSGEAASFRVSDGGLGLIFTALAEDPYRFDEFQLGNAWNSAALTISRDTKDPEADLTALVQRMASPRGFDYDIQEYAVLGEVLVDQGVTPPAWWSPTYVFVDGYGGPGCFSCGYFSPAGITIGVGFGWSWGYSPYYWGWPYSYWGYGYPGYGYGYGYPYYPGYYPPYYPGGGGHPGYGPKVVGRPRGYEVRPPGQPEPHGGTNVVRGGNGLGGSIGGEAGPARRARGGMPGGARPNDGQPANRGAEPATGNNNGGRATGGGSPGGAPAPRARPRGGDRPPTDARIAAQPNVEQSRPAVGPSVNWVQVEDLGSARSANTARSVNLSRSAAAAPPARRTRGGGISSVWSQGLAQARASAGQSARSSNRGSSARPSANRGGSPSFSRPSGPRVSSGGGSAGARPSGGGGGSVGARPSGGGGGRARGRP